jgi:hypothetical protein
MQELILGLAELAISYLLLCEIKPQDSVCLTTEEIKLGV